MVQIIDDEKFDGFIQTGIVLIDFFAEWCGPCKMLTPVLESLESEVTNVTIGKINIDNSPKTAENLGISSIPTIILFKNGKEVERVVGLKDKDFLVSMISKHA